MTTAVLTGFSYTATAGVWTFLDTVVATIVVPDTWSSSYTTLPGSYLGMPEVAFAPSGAPYNASVIGTSTGATVSISTTEAYFGEVTWIGLTAGSEVATINSTDVMTEYDASTGIYYSYFVAGDMPTVSFDPASIIGTGSSSGNLAPGSIFTLSDFDNVFLSENDYIAGSGNSDTFNSGEGNDTVYGLGGDDQINGGTGSDRIYGDMGDDTLNGDAGFDEIYGGMGNDAITGGDDNDNLNGAAGNDVLFGDSGDDVVYGNSGDDSVFGGSGTDFVYGGTGNDDIYGGSGADFSVGSAGNDFIYSGSGNDIGYGGADQDNLNGGSGNDMMYGGGGNDFFEDSQGDDQYYGGAGDDVFFDFGLFLEVSQEAEILGVSADIDAYYGGGGADEFLFGDTGGQNHIYGFNVADGDMIFLSGLLGFDWTIAAFRGDEATGSTYIKSTSSDTDIRVYNVSVDDIMLSIGGLLE